MVATMKDTSTLHRLRSSIPFLETLLAHVLNHRSGGEQVGGPTSCIKDATVHSVPGSTGIDWRLHATYDPCRHALTRVVITDRSGGELLYRDQYFTDDIVIADHGPAHARGLHAVAEANAWTTVRMHWHNIRLLNADRTRVDMASVLERAQRRDVVTIVCIPFTGEQPLRARLLVCPLPIEQANLARRRLRKQAKKRGEPPMPLRWNWQAVSVCSPPFQKPSHLPMWSLHSTESAGKSS
jgi:hypothetical protein